MPDHLKVFIQLDNHQADDINGAAGTLRPRGIDPLHGAERNGMAVRQPRGFMMEIGNGVRSSGYQLLGYAIGVGLADNVAGQVDLANHLLIHVVPETAGTCPTALRDHQEGGSQQTIPGNDARGLRMIEPVVPEHRNPSNS